MLSMLLICFEYSTFGEFFLLPAPCGCSRYSKYTWISIFLLYMLLLYGNFYNKEFICEPSFSSRNWRSGLWDLQWTLSNRGRAFFSSDNTRDGEMPKLQSCFPNWWCEFEILIIPCKFILRVHIFIITFKFNLNCYYYTGFLPLSSRLISGGSNDNRYALRTLSTLFSWSNTGNLCLWCLWGWFQ